jgi:hypothetical protein
LCLRVCGWVEDGEVWGSGAAGVIHCGKASQASLALLVLISHSIIM